MEKSRSRRGVVPAVEGFYPGEVAALLGLDGVDYAQLRRLHNLVVPDTNEDKGGGWLRFTVTQIAAAKRALELLGGRESLRPKRRLQWRLLERVCRVLRERHGIKNPLLELRLVRQGGSIWALHEGVTLEPLSGQLEFPDLEQSFKDYGKVVPMVGSRKGARAAKEMAKLASSRPAKVALGAGRTLMIDDSEQES